MKIGIDARVLQGIRRGQGEYVYYLIKKLVEIDKNNEYVIFYNSLKRGEFIFDENIPNLKQVWCHIPGRILKLLWSRFSWPSMEFLLGNIDIFHNTLNYNSVYFTPLPAVKRAVSTFHGMAAPELLGGSYTYHDFRKWAETVAYSASIIITVSQMAKENFLQYASFSEDKLRVIYLAADERFKPINDKNMLKKNLSAYKLSDKKYILYVGSEEANKNIKRLLKAFSIINEKHDLYLVMAGGINPMSLKDEIKGIKDKVIFLGYILHSDLVYLYNGAQLLVLPTLYEWFGLPVLEAMACGIPAVVSKNTGVLEVVDDAAITFDPENTEEMADCIMRVLQNESLSDSLGKKGCEKSKLLSWEKTAKETIIVYNEIWETERG